MKKLLTALLVSPFALASCSTEPVNTTPTPTPEQTPAPEQTPTPNPTPTPTPDTTPTPNPTPAPNPTPTPPTQSDNDIVQAKIGRDWISDMYDKDYTRKDMRIINKLEESVFSVSYGSSFVGAVNGSPINSSTCHVASQVNPGETNFPSIEMVGQDTTTTEMITETANGISGATTQVPRSIVGNEKRLATRGTSFIIDENSTHYFVASNAHVATDIVADPANPGKFITTVSNCVVFRSNDSRNISFTPDYTFDYQNKSLVVDNAQEVNITDSYTNTIGAIWTGNGLDFNKFGNIWKGSIDMMIFPVKKSDVKDHTGSQKTLAPVPLGDFNFYNSAHKNDTSYTAGYPYNTKRFNKVNGGGGFYNIPGKSFDQAILDGTEITFSATSRKFSNDLVSQNKWYQKAGSSGSPVINSAGELIGINSMLTRLQQHSGSQYDTSQFIQVRQIKEAYTNFLCPLAATKNLVMNLCS